MNIGTNTAPPDTAAELQSIVADIAALRSDIAALVAHVSSNAFAATSDATRNVADQLAYDAARVYENVASQANRSAQAIGRQVEQQPVTSLLIVFALGFLGGRVMSR